MRSTLCAYKMDDKVNVTFINKKVTYLKIFTL